jgi:signal peptidase I
MTHGDVAGGLPPARQQRRLRKGVTRTAFWLLVGIATALLITSLAMVVLPIRGFVDSSPTMEHTISAGDHLFVTSGSAGIRRGDIVVLHVPATDTGAGNTFVKRVIGLPGDHVACCDARGRVTVNGKPLDETYLYPGDPPSMMTFSVTLGKGQLWVMGDRRNISIDSRKWGPVSQSGVTGRVILVIHGSSFTALKTPQAFVAAGLAPPDTRVDHYLRLIFLAAACLAALVLLAIVGITSVLVRGRRSRRIPPPLPGPDPDSAVPPPREPVAPEADAVIDPQP